jgi:preprotein translocase subunit Sec61beta
MASEKITAPQSMSGILRFNDTNSGGPPLEPKAVLVFTIVFILVVKIISFLVGSG